MSARRGIAMIEYLVFATTIILVILALRDLLNEKIGTQGQAGSLMSEMREQLVNPSGTADTLLR